ncbi:hypothetical protein [uncultured Rubinisphaera sp.]|uniref:hypothetical protein n=1 Tax=uncultured Rubinisphaera sp. TaxID=1678686 RepID=UPI000EB868C9|nr:hypothetical protein [Planctomycetaceae bacterium]
MQITVNAPNEKNRSNFQKSVAIYISNTLNRFSHRIASVSVSLIDENGPRGGVDQRCRICVVIPRFGEIVSTADHENQWAAITLAAGRVRRLIVTKLKRPQSLRVRKRKVLTGVFESDTE